MTFWNWILWVLTWLSADPVAFDREAARAAAAVSAARASMAIEAPSPTPPAPGPKPDKCCGDCVNGWITHGDGHRTACPCPASCKCKGAKGCPDGKCRVPGASPATGSPARP
jgi:hypothetical protein